MVTLYPYQQTGVEFLRKHRRAILGDEMGLGKTAQVLTALPTGRTVTSLATGRKVVLGPNPRTVVVCPASVRHVWANEAALWRPDLTVDVVETGKHAPTSADLTVISYDLFGRVRLPRPATIVCDEAHYLQSRNSRRTAAVYFGAGEAQARSAIRLWLLTGTPLWSRPRSLFPLLHLCAGTTLGRYTNYHRYAVQFCAGATVRRPRRGGFKNVFDDTGASNLEELRELLGPYLLRRLKADVLDELPGKTRQFIPINSKLSKAERELDALDFDSLGDNGLPPGPIATAVKETALLKVGSVAAHVRDVLANEDKVVVFAWNRAVMDALETALHDEYGVARIDGSTPAKSRPATIRSFQENTSASANRPRVFLGQTVAAGTGITLTAARVVVFAQPDWTPANLLQAEDRVHRIGQPDNVLVHYLVTRGSIEETMLSKVRDKLDTSGEVLGEERR